jgi:hypothetical protein
MSSAPDTAGARTGPSWHPAASEVGSKQPISRGVFGFERNFFEDCATDGTAAQETR